MDTEDNKVNWLKVKCFRFEKKHPGLILFRYGHSGNYMTINSYGRGRFTTPTLSKVYTSPFPISGQKYSDLTQLYEKGVIPQEFHSWYKSLPKSNNSKSLNPEPSQESDSDIEDGFI